MRYLAEYSEYTYDYSYYGSSYYNSGGMKQAEVKTVIGVYLAVVFGVFVTSYVLPPLLTYCCCIKPQEAKVGRRRPPVRDGGGRMRRSDEREREETQD